MRPVPEIAAAELLPWMYQHQDQVYLSGPDYQTLVLPAAHTLDEVLAHAESQGNHWILLDGPRGERNHWLIDPWWVEQPEMKQKLIDITQARALPIAALRAILQQLG
jgi:hypothetical protein